MCNSIQLLPNGIVALAAAFAASPAIAAVTISTDATANMSCLSGVCEPTATDAVLNVSDLENMLASGNVTVFTTGAGVQANNIDIKAALTWSSTAAFTLDAHRSIIVNQPVSVAGFAGLALTTGKKGELSFGRNGNVTFANLSSSLTIDGAGYTLVNTTKGLAAAIANNPGGDYALAQSYDARQDRTYSSSPIPTQFSGTFEGLGNEISRVRIHSDSIAGFFTVVNHTATVRDFGLADLKLDADEYAGGLAEYNVGLIKGCFVTGSVKAAGRRGTAGGLLLENDGGTISESWSAAAVIIGGDSVVGGLAGTNIGIIENSFAIGSATQKGVSSRTAEAGGFVGQNLGSIANSYATGSVTSGNSQSGGNLVGGFLGENSGTVSTSYSTGSVVDYAEHDTYVGGLIGDDGSKIGSLTDTLWDTDTSGISNPDQGAGTPLNDPGIIGLTTQQFQSGLPSGFDPKIWAEDPKINNGLPYLINNPPPK